MTANWTVVLADDEEFGRRTLRNVLQNRSDFRVVGEATDGPGALELLDKLRPDLAFLDVQMPGMDGFDVLRALPPRQWPLVVFCTGYTEYALKAFEVNALDYLLKPFDDERALRTLDRAAALLGQPEHDVRERLERVLAATENGNFIERIPIRRNGKVEIVDLDEVEWISAAGNYVELHCDGRRHLYRSALSKLVDRLDPQRFVRIHRSTVVNVGRVRELEPTPQGDWKLSLDTGAHLRLSRRFREALELLVPRPRSQQQGG